MEQRLPNQDALLPLETHCPISTKRGGPCLASGFPCPAPDFMTSERRPRSGLKRARMSGSARLIAIIVLALLVFAGAYALLLGVAGSGGFFAAAPTAERVSNNTVPNAPLLGAVRILSHFCVRNEAYALLSLPPQASFDLVAGGAKGPARYTPEAQRRRCRSRDSAIRRLARRPWRGQQASVLTHALKSGPSTATS